MSPRCEQIIAEMRKFENKWWFKEFNSDQGVCIQWRTWWQHGDFMKEIDEYAAMLYELKLIQTKEGE